MTQALPKDSGNDNVSCLDSSCILYSQCQPRDGYEQYIRILIQIPETPNNGFNVYTIIVTDMKICCRIKNVAVFAAASRSAFSLACAAFR
jgi:hypothetical protein